MPDFYDFIHHDGEVIYSAHVNEFLAQSQVYTTTGSATAYTLATFSELPLTNGETWRVKFHANAGATPTLKRDSETAKSLKYYDDSGAKQDVTAAQIIAGVVCSVIYDGVDYVVYPAFVPLPPAPTPPRAPLRIIVTSNTTFVKGDYPAFAFADVELVGGGGGGGGLAGNSGNAKVAGAGSGGAWRMKRIPYADIASSVSIEIGAGGAAGAAGNNNGGNGGGTKFGAGFTANGGKGGTGRGSSTSFPAPSTIGGASGTGTADLSQQGGAGIMGYVYDATNTSPSLGGSTRYAGNAMDINGSTWDGDGVNGLGFGGGASGARSSSDATNRAGGNGADGVCIITLHWGTV